MPSDTHAMPRNTHHHPGIPTNTHSSPSVPKLPHLCKSFGRGAGAGRGRTGTHRTPGCWRIGGSSRRCGPRTRPPLAKGNEREKSLFIDVSRFAYWILKIYYLGIWSIIYLLCRPMWSTPSSTSSKGEREKKIIDVSLCLILSIIYLFII